MERHGLLDAATRCSSTTTAWSHARRQIHSCTVIRRPPSGNVISQDSFIERIDHNFDGTQWTITYGLTPRTNTITANWFILGDASKGKLGTGVLGF